MQKRGKTALTLVGFAVMLAALLALMASIGARKDGFDIDEFFTYGLANSYHQPFLNTETGRWISGRAFSDYLTASGHAHEYFATCTSTSRLRSMRSPTCTRRCIICSCTRCARCFAIRRLPSGRALGSTCFSSA